jgi:hypothetical protein
MNTHSPCHSNFVKCYLDYSAKETKPPLSKSKILEYNYCPLKCNPQNKKATQFLVAWLYPFISGVGRD